MPISTPNLIGSQMSLVAKLTATNRVRSPADSGHALSDRPTKRCCCPGETSMLNHRTSVNMQRLTLEFGCGYDVKWVPSMELFPCTPGSYWAAKRRLPRWANL